MYMENHIHIHTHTPEHILLDNIFFRIPGKCIFILSCRNPQHLAKCSKPDKTLSILYMCKTKMKIKRKNTKNRCKTVTKRMKINLRWKRTVLWCFVLAMALTLIPFFRILKKKSIKTYTRNKPRIVSNE